MHDFESRKLCRSIVGWTCYVSKPNTSGEVPNDR